MTTILGWLCLVLVLVGLGVVAGIFLNNWLAEQRQQSLCRSEAKLQAEWNALHTAQRLNAAFMESRRVMWEEAVRQHPRHPQP